MKYMHLLPRRSEEPCGAVDLDLESLIICQMSRGDRDRTRTQSYVQFYFGINHYPAGCFSGAKTGGDAKKRPTNHKPLSPAVGTLSTSFSNEGFKDSSF